MVIAFILRILSVLFTDDMVPMVSLSWDLQLTLDGLQASKKIRIKILDHGSQPTKDGVLTQEEQFKCLVHKLG